LTYRTRLIIYAVDRPGILNELTGIVSGENVNIASIETRETNKPEQLAIIELTMELEHVTQLDRIVAAMRRLRDVREVTRSHRN
jgi:GTP pyrophosphokinase